MAWTSLSETVLFAESAEENISLERIKEIVKNVAKRNGR